MQVDSGRLDGAVIISQLADAITINECSSRLPVQRISRLKFVGVQECSSETRVRRRNRGLSRRSEDYDVRILPTARCYYGRVQLPRNPDRNDGGDGDGADGGRSRFTIRGRIHDQVSGPFASLRLRLVRRMPKLYHADPSHSLSFSVSLSSLSLSASIVLCMCLIRTETLTRLGRCASINHRRFRQCRTYVSLTR